MAVALARSKPFITSVSIYSPPYDGSGRPTLTSVSVHPILRQGDEIRLPDASVASNYMGDPSVVRSNDSPPSWVTVIAVFRMGDEEIAIASTFVELIVITKF